MSDSADPTTSTPIKRPKARTTTTVTKEVGLTLEEPELVGVLISYLTRMYPEFRNMEITFNGLQRVEATAKRVTEKEE